MVRWWWWFRLAAAVCAAAALSLAAAALFGAATSLLCREEKARTRVVAPAAVIAGKITTDQIMTSRLGFVSSDWMERREGLYQLRNQLIKKVCNKKRWRDRKSHHTARPLMVDNANKMAYCPICKVGTSTWMHHFLMLSNLDNEVKEHLTHQRRIHMLWKYLYATKKVPLPDPDALRFAFVRHPFDRIISAYENKIVDGLYSQLIDLLNRRYGDQSFESFAMYVISNWPWNCHWRRQADLCDFCSAGFDVVGKMETFDDDAKYILAKLGLNGRVDPAVHMNLGSAKKENQDKTNITERIGRYFSSLSEDARLALCDFYRVDIELFGYEYKQFL